MGGWGVFFLLLLIGFLVYFFGGMLILRYRGAEGVETIPNYSFWISLPSRAIETVKYWANGCKKPDGGYESI